MTRALIRPAFPLLAMATLLAACAGSSDRYPSLSLRDFERVQGQFPTADSQPEQLRPSPLPVAAVEQVSDAIGEARIRHSQFLAQAEKARGVVSAARGSNPDDKRWAMALIEVAELDSRHGVTTGLLADLDALYANASLEFQQREEVAQAQAEIAQMVASEQQAIDELAALLGPA